MNTKAQSLGNALLGIALVIVIFSAGFYFSGPKPAVSGNVVGITGMATQVIVKYDVPSWSWVGHNGVGDIYYKWDGNKWQSSKDKSNWENPPSSVGLSSSDSLADGLNNLIDYSDVVGSNDRISVSYDGNTWTDPQEFHVGSQETTTFVSTVTNNVKSTVQQPVVETKTDTPKKEETPAPVEVKPTEPDAQKKEAAVVTPAQPGSIDNPLEIPSNLDKIATTGYYTTADGQIIPLTAGTPINQEQKETAPSTPDTAATSQPTTTYAFDIKSSTLYGITDNKDGTTTYTESTSTSNDGGKTATYTPKQDGTTIKLSTEIAEEIDWNKYSLTKNSYANQFTTKDGRTTISVAGDTYTYKDTSTSLITKEVIGTTKIEYTYKEKDGKLTTEKESVTYTSPTGTLTVNGDVYNQIDSTTRNIFMEAAIGAGTTSITQYDAATKSITYGRITIKQIGGVVYSYSGSGDDKNVVQYTTDGEKTTYTGVKFNDQTADFDLPGSEEYTMTETDADGNVVLYEKKEKIGEGKFETFTAVYPDENTIGIRVVSDDTSKKDINMEFTKNGNYFQSGNVYFDTSSGEFTYGSEHYDIYEKDGKYYYKNKKGTETLIDGLPKGATDALREAYDTKEVKEGRETITQKKWQSGLATFESILTEFSGLRGFSQLFWSDEDLDEWRESVDKVFASMYLGTDYWVSDICSKGVEREGEGTMYIETPGGLLEVGAHIEAEKTEPIDYQNGTSERLYKITYKVTNPEYEATTRERPEISFNVYLYGDITVQLYSEDIVVEEGGSFSRMGSSAIVQYSSHEYSKVCIVFRDSILAVGTEEVSEVCNEVTMYTGPATEYQTTGVEVTSGGSGYGYGEEVDF